jgi:hypothetical protein
MQPRQYVRHAGPLQNQCGARHASVAGALLRSAGCRPRRPESRACSDSSAGSTARVEHLDVGSPAPGSAVARRPRSPGDQRLRWMTACLADYPRRSSLAPSPPGRQCMVSPLDVYCLGVKAAIGADTMVIGKVGHSRGDRPRARCRHIRRSCCSVGEVTACSRGHAASRLRFRLVNGLESRGAGGDVRGTRYGHGCLTCGGRRSRTCSSAMRGVVLAARPNRLVRRRW